MIRQVEKHSFVPELLGDGSIIVDLGMNRGDFACSLLEMCDCTIYGAEPDPRLFSSLPSRSNIHARQVAITGENNKVTLYLNPTQCSTIERGLLESDALGTEVEGVTLDTLLSRFGIVNVDLLKVDIEGAEIDMFDSLSDDSIYRFRQITVEFHDFLDKSLENSVIRIIRRLRNLGFQRLKFTTFTNGDLLFIHPEYALPRYKAWLLLARCRYADGLWRRAVRIMRTEG